MSTRSQILVDGHNAIIYRHSDGYPDGEHGVLASLLPLVKDFMLHRGPDPEYLTAQIIADQIKRHHDWFENWEKRFNAPLQREYRYIGFGVEAWGGLLHGDIEYLYIVKTDHVEVRKPKKGFWGNSTLANTKRLKLVDFNGDKFTKRV